MVVWLTQIYQIDVFANISTIISERHHRENTYYHNAEKVHCKKVNSLQKPQVFLHLVFI